MSVQIVVRHASLNCQQLFASPLRHNMDTVAPSLKFVISHHPHDVVRPVDIADLASRESSLSGKVLDELLSEIPLVVESNQDLGGFCPALATVKVSAESQHSLNKAGRYVFCLIFVHLHPKIKQVRKDLASALKRLPEHCRPVWSQDTPDLTKDLT